jgi:O-antigen/teichoic acid export membrane protein
VAASATIAASATTATGAAGGVRRLAVNTAAPLLARVVDAGFAVVYLRLLGRPQVGDYTFVVVVTTFLDTLVDFGLNALVAREVARGAVGAGAAFRVVNLLRLGLGLLGLEANLPGVQRVV